MPSTVTENSLPRLDTPVSADPKIEPGIAGADGAWVVTKSGEVYDQLRMLLDAPSRMKSLAAAGYDWALRSCSRSAGSEKLKKSLQAASL